MKVCKKCGKYANSDSDMFCSKCGGDLVEKTVFSGEAGDASAGGKVNSVTTQNFNSSQGGSSNNDEIYFDQEDIAKNKIFAIFAYFGILFLIPMLAAKDSPYAKFHANQGLVLFLINMGISVVTVFINFIGILSIVTLVFMIMGIINAANGKGKKLPLIGSIEIYK